MLIVCLIVWRVLNYGVRINPNDYENQEFTADISDNLIPFIRTEEQKAKDDGITTIVAMGNAPFADDRDSDQSLANIIAKKADAVVYNCAVADSYLAAESISPVYSPVDAFNFYWLAYSFCAPNSNSSFHAYDADLKQVYQNVFEEMGDSLSEEGRNVYYNLLSIDFNTVDVIVIMYDASDYMLGRPVYDPEYEANIQTFSGNLTAGIDLIQDAYPHIQIIVMSPTFAYAVDDDGEYVNSETYRYGDFPLSSYMSMEGNAAAIEGVTFLDNLYGTVYESIAPDCLKDNLHLNEKGRELVAERFLYALDYYKPAS